MSSADLPDAPPTGDRRRTLATVVGSVVFLALGTLLQLPRQSGVHLWRTVWAEDGTRFYTDALARPWSRNVLESYAGYAHVVPRTLASIGTHLPIAWYSVYVSVAAALAGSLCALFVYFASAPLLRSRVRQAILAGALLFWPILPLEITGSITNIQWVLPVACLLAVLLPVERPLPVLARVPIVVLAPLSSPICVLFVPIALLQAARVFTRGSRPIRLVVPAVYTAAAAVQMVVFLTAPQIVGDKATLRRFAPDLVELYPTKVVGELVFGVKVTQELWDSIGYGFAVLAVLGILVALGWRLWRADTPTSRWVIVLLVGASAVIYAASLWQRSSAIGDMLLVVGQPYNFTSMRYQLFPAALLLIALLVPLDLERGAIVDPGTPARPPWSVELRAERFALVVAAVWVLVAFVPSYRFSTYRSAGPDWVIGVDQAESACAIDPSVGAVAVPISPAPIWAVAVPCADLVGAP